MTESTELRTKQEDVNWGINSVTATIIEKNIRKVVGNKHFLRVTFLKRLGESIYIQFAKGKDESEWSNGYIQNDAAYTTAHIWNHSKGGELDTSQQPRLYISEGLIKKLRNKKAPLNKINDHLVKWFTDFMKTIDTVELHY